jgi:cytochrome c-type biogenesis protein CcmF
MITLIVFALVIAVAKVYNISYLVLTLAGIYLIVSNIKVLLSLLKRNPKLSGGAIAHIGVGLMLIGVMFSAGYSKVVSLNNSGMLISKEVPTEFNRDNLLLFINEPRSMAGYDLEYRGERVEARHKSGYINKNDIEKTFDAFKVVAKKDIIYKGKKLYSAKDTFEIYPENTFYEIELRKNNEVVASLFPRVQINAQMGGFVPSPDIRRKLTSDLYTHVSLPMNREGLEWGKLEELKVQMGEEFHISSKYISSLEQVVRINEIEGVPLQPEDVAVQAKIKIQGEHEIFYADPIFLIRNKNQVGRIPSEINDLGVKITLLNILPDTNEFLIGINARQKDWVVIKALEKPFINILWIGTMVLMVGFTMAMVRRFREFEDLKMK